MDYSDVIRYFLDPANNYSKDDLYEAYLDMTVRFLEELISANTYEDWIIANCGEETGNLLIEQVATNVPPIPGEVGSGPVSDKEDRIEALLSYIKNNFGK